MKKVRSFLGFLLAVVVSTSFLSCQKAPINGNLDGQWEVMEVYPKPENEVIDQRLFYNFYLHVCQLTYYGGYFLDGEISYDGESLYINFPAKLNNFQVKGLSQYGISTNPVVFDVEFPDKNSLILSNEEAMVVLRKF